MRRPNGGVKRRSIAPLAGNGGSPHSQARVCHAPSMAPIPEPGRRAGGARSPFICGSCDPQRFPTEPGYAPRVMPRIDLLIALFVLAVPLVALARVIKVGYPVVLVLGGLALCFVPGLPRAEIHPQLIFLVFLPPLLYWQALTAPKG